MSLTVSCSKSNPPSLRTSDHQAVTSGFTLVVFPGALSVLPVAVNGLTLTSTQHATKYLMLHTFGKVATTQIIGDRMAKTGCTAAVKYIDQARAALAPDDAGRAAYASLYVWYRSTLKDRIEQLKQASS